MSNKQQLKNEYIKNWNEYIADLKRIALNLTSDSDREELESHIKGLERLVKVAALEHYSIEAEEDVDGFLNAYRVA